MENENHSEIATVAANLQMLKQEVDSLQIAFAKQNRPWYRDAATILSVMALVFSFGTTWVSNRKAEAQDIENQRSELRSLLQRMAELPKENLDATEKYRSNPGAFSTVASLINQENTFLSGQAAEIAKRLPPGKISAVEYYAIAIALGNAYNIEGEKKFLALSIASATDFNTEIAAIRTNAYVLFLTGRPDAGRVEFQKALAIFDKYGEFDEYTRKSTGIKTELSWAFSEYLVRAGNPLIEQHLKNAQDIMEELPPSPGREQMDAEIRQARSQLMASNSAHPGPSGR
jgi:hypothetical protein